MFANDTLPHKICEVCNAKVDDFYQFWTSTAKNQKQLNDWLQVATDQKVDHASVAVPRVSGILTKVLNGSVTVPRVSECWQKYWQSYEISLNSQNSSYTDCDDNLFQL